MIDLDESITLRHYANQAENITLVLLSIPLLPKTVPGSRTLFKSLRVPFIYSLGVKT